GPRDSGERAVLTVRRDRDDDRVAQEVIEVELAKLSRREGFDDDARGPGEPGEEGAPVGRHEVAGDAALVHVRRDPRNGALAVLDVADERRPQPVGFTAGWLDFHDIGAEVREDSPAHGAAQVREI